MAFYEIKFTDEDPPPGEKYVTAVKTEEAYVALVFVFEQDMWVCHVTGEGVYSNPEDAEREAKIMAQQEDIPWMKYRV